MCRCLSSKEIHKEAITYWKKEIPQLMCELKKYLAPIFFSAQEHYLINQDRILKCVDLYTYKVNVDGGEALEGNEGLC